MELVLTVGLPCVTFFFGFVLGNRIAIRSIQEAVNAGLAAGSQICYQSLYQRGLLKEDTYERLQEETKEQTEELQQSYGFNLKEK